MNSPTLTDPEWHLTLDQQYLGAYRESALRTMATAGLIKPGTVMTNGRTTVTLADFLAGKMPPTANGPATGPPPTNGPGTNGPPANGIGFHPDAALAADLGLSSNPPMKPAGGPPALPLGHASGRISSAPPTMPPILPPPFAAPPMPAQAPAMAPPPYADFTPPSAPEVPAAQASAPAASSDDEDGPPERDRIVVIGRRQSGKTIYLASVYNKLWRNLDGLTAKALRGAVHKQLMEVSSVLATGHWPAATLETRQMEFELEEGGRKRLMVALDYAGEMFANAFVHDRTDIPEVKVLVDHIDRAAAVILLIDPSIIAGMDHGAAVEDDFGLVQAVQRIRNWPGGDNVPVVLVLTKIDQHQRLLDRFGGPDGFCRHHFPALVRLLKKVAIFQVSAVQVVRGKDGKLVPKPDSTSMNVDNPLRYCLRQILRAEEKAEQERAEIERRQLEARIAREAEIKEKRQNLMVIIGLSAIVIVGVAIILLVVIL